MGDPRVHQYTFEGGAECLIDLRHFVTQALMDLGAGEDDVFAFELSADEAVTNSLLHAYEGKGGRVEVTISREDGEVVLVVRDWGTPFDPDRVAEPRLDLPIEERPPGGLGLFLIHQFMDQVSFAFDQHAGNTITMRRRLGVKR